MGQHDKPGQGGQQQDQKEGQQPGQRQGGENPGQSSNPQPQHFGRRNDRGDGGKGSGATRARGPLEGLEVHSSPFAERDTHIGGVIHRLEIPDETIYETERVHEVLKIDVRDFLFCASSHPASRGMMARSSLAVRIFGLTIVVISVSRLAQSLKIRSSPLEILPNGCECGG